MRALKSHICKALPVGSIVNVADNSGARKVQIINVAKRRGVKRRRTSAGIGDMIYAVVKDGNPDMKHKIIQAVVVRQKEGIRRPNGIRVTFDDNAVVVLKDPIEGEPKGTAIKGPIAREVTLRWPHIGKIAGAVV